MMSDAQAPGVYFKTLGCKVNRVESEQIGAELLGRGVVVVDEYDADVIVINTCTVTGEADSKARKAVRQSLALPLDPVVVVTGCLASVDAGSLRALGERVIVEADKTKVAQRVAAILDVAPTKAAPVVRAGSDFRTRVAVKIEDGCDAFCSYCIIPYARGGPTSVPAVSLIEECDALARAGVSEIVLTGINLGRYRDGELTLPSLIERLAATGIPRIRLSSIEPLDLTDELLGVLGLLPAACAHLHVPLQSGCDEVLAAMNRNYDVAEFERRIAAARAAIPEVTFTTDVITGFPTETGQQARTTLATCERIGFSKLHVFRYSPRRGTPAADMPMLDPTVVAARSAELRELSDRMRGEFLAGKVGEEVEVLVESVRDGMAKGTTRDYANVQFSARDVLPGSIVGVRVSGREGQMLLG